jgi:hypothetical protein
MWLMCIELFENAGRFGNTALKNGGNGTQKLI